MPNDFTYMWNLKNKINEQTKQKQIHRYREKTDGCQKVEVLGKRVKKYEDIKKHKLVATKESRGL